MHHLSISQAGLEPAIQLFEAKLDGWVLRGP